MGNVFYETTHDLINNEILRFEEICSKFDNDPEEKRIRISEYKCAKYRLSALWRIQNMLFHGKRVIEKGCCHLEIEEALEGALNYSSIYNESEEQEKLEVKLYYGIRAFTEKKLEELSSISEYANDWERIELNEKIVGYTFALRSLNEGWEKRNETKA